MLLLPRATNLKRNVVDDSLGALCLSPCRRIMAMTARDDRAGVFTGRGETIARLLCQLFSGRLAYRLPVRAELMGPGLDPPDHLVDGGRQTLAQGAQPPQAP